MWLGLLDGWVQQRSGTAFYAELVQQNNCVVLGLSGEYADLNGVYRLRDDLAEGERPSFIRR